MTLFCLGAAAGAVLCAGGFALWYARSVAAPTRELENVADGLARGEHGARARPSELGRLAPLGASLNLLAEKIQHDIAELRRLEKVRKEFVANVSHELRTPLASITAFAETLSGGALEDEAHRGEFVREIEANAERMTRLVEDLLSLSALESGRMPPDFQPLSLMRPAAEVVASLTPLAQKKRIVLRLEPFGDAPPVRADKNQIKQVFVNLLGNAIKFTGENGTVRVRAAARAGKVTVFVEDDGIGIPPAELPRLFERFYRVDKARSRELGGTGLGLSIVKRIVELHGGSVGVESAGARGSVFHFTLPQA